MKLSVAATLLLSALALHAADPQWILLWPNGAPGSQGKTGDETVTVTAQGEHVTANVHRPSIAVILPPKDKATGAAVIIAPGGGHSTLWADHEGLFPAQWLADHGVAGIVLIYRLAREKGSTYTIEGDSLADMQRAIRLVRSRAAEWAIDPARVGVMGFSAGGEIAALAATRYDAGAPDAPDPIDRLSSKPAFEALLYPAIPKDMKLSKDTPPSFLGCGENDRLDISQGLPELYLQLKKAGAVAELHVYTGVGHGFGVRTTTKGAVANWPARFLEFLEARKLVPQK